MGDTNTVTNGGGNGWYSAPGYSSCNDDYGDFCFYDPEGKAGTAPPIQYTPKPAPPVVDTCETSDAPPCGDDDPLGLGAMDQQWNNGQGPTAQLDPEWRKQEGARCDAAAAEKQDKCIAGKQRSAEQRCAVQPNGNPGRAVDGRPVDPKDYDACVDGWVFGADGTSSAEEESTTDIDTSMSGTEKKGQGHGSVKFGSDNSPVQVEIGGGYEEAHKDERTTGTEKQKGSSKGTNTDPHPGMVEQCNEDYLKEQQLCQPIYP